MKSISVLTLTVSLGVCQGALAQQDKYGVTPQEQTACQDDAMAFCSDAYPDEDKLLVCMKQNRSQLSPTCRQTFEAGLKRRHMS